MSKPAPIHLPVNTRGYSVEPCPGCREAKGPGEPALTVPGEWYVWHVECYESSVCDYCHRRHRGVRDGRCLL